MNAPIAPMPPAQEPTVRYMDAMKFAFSTPDAWTNILLAFVFQLIPMVGPIALLGWFAEIFQRLVKRHPKPIPKLEFGDFTHYLSRGVAPFACAFLVALPVVFLVTIPMMVLGGVMSALASAPHARGHAPDPTVPLIMMGVVFVGISIFAPIMSIFTNAVFTRAELTEDIGQSLKFGKLVDYVKLTWVTTLIGFFVMSILSTVTVFAGMLVCFIGVYAAAVIVRLAGLHFRWQIYEIYLARGGEQIPLKVQTEQIPSERARGGQ